jgi:MoxR-like ATPase
MEQNTTHSGNKTVYQSEPFNPRKEFMGGFVGRTHEQRLITAAWIAGQNHLPMSPLLIGDPGVGKNRLVYEMARQTGQELYIFQGHEDVTAEDLACSVRFSDHSNTVMDYILSPLVTAMKRGGICFIDEIGKIRPRALALLVSVLDERRYIDSTLLGERIFADKAFRFIAATNSADVNLLPEFILSRMKPVIKVDYPNSVEIDEVIKAQYKGMNGEILNLLEVFWRLWRDKSSSHFNLSTRDAINVFSLASNLAAMDASRREMHADASKASEFVIMPLDGEYMEIKPIHLESAFMLLFGEQLN